MIFLIYQAFPKVVFFVLNFRPLLLETAFTSNSNYCSPSNFVFNFAMNPHPNCNQINQRPYYLHIAAFILLNYTPPAFLQFFLNVFLKYSFLHSIPLKSSCFFCMNFGVDDAKKSRGGCKLFWTTKFFEKKLKQKFGGIFRFFENFMEFFFWNFLWKYQRNA